VESVAFSRDGTTLAAADGEAVAFWDVSNPAAPGQLGQPLVTGNGSPVDSVAFSPDGTTLVADDSNGAQVWNRNIRSAIGRTCDLKAGQLTPQQWTQSTRANSTTTDHEPCSIQPAALGWPQTGCSC